MPPPPARSDHRRARRRLRHRCEGRGQHARARTATASSSPNSTPRCRSRTLSTSSCTTRSPNPSPTTKRSACSSPTRARAELWSIPGTFTRISSPALGSTAPTGICRRPCPPGNWSPPWSQCTPGETVISDVAPRARSAPGLDWPGRGEGLSDREAEILALITQGKSNADVATTDLPEPQHREVLHPNDLPQARRRQPYPGRAVGGQSRLHP